MPTKCCFATVLYETHQHFVAVETGGLWDTNQWTGGLGHLLGSPVVTSPLSSLENNPRLNWESGGPLTHSVVLLSPRADLYVAQLIPHCWLEDYSLRSPSVAEGMQPRVHRTFISHILVGFSHPFCHSLPRDEKERKTPSQL